MTTLESYLSRKTRKSIFISIYGLAYREVKRFLHLPVQTMLFPILNVGLYSLIFFFIQQQGVRNAGYDTGNLTLNSPFIRFLAIGLIAKECLLAGYGNPLSSLMQAKLVGNYVDLLIAPLGHLGIWAGFVLGALVRTIMVFLIAYLTVCSIYLKYYPLDSFLLLLYALTISAICVGSLGLAIGVIGETFDQVTLFMIIFFQPLLYLGGVFFSVEILPPIFQKLTYCNIFFYVVNLYRAAILNEGDLPTYILMLAGFISAFVSAIISILVMKSKKLGLQK